MSNQPSIRLMTHNTQLYVCQDHTSWVCELLILKPLITCVLHANSFLSMSLFLDLLKRLMNLLRSLKKAWFHYVSSFWQWHTRGYSSKTLCMSLISLQTSFLTVACALMISLTCMTASYVTKQRHWIHFEVNRIFSYTLTIHLSLMPLQLIVSSRYHLIHDITLEPFRSYKHWASV
jgi:hypothetical protein